MNVMMPIGINDTGSFHPLRIADGNNTKNAIKIHVIIEFNFKSIVAVINPTITHIENAEAFASQVNP